jgi:hypothetical protein
MSTYFKPLSDKVFLAEFENQTLDPQYFNHLGHLRIAWLYLNRHNVETAVDLVCAGIQTYAESLGAKDKFNLTMTDALVRIMAKRIDYMQEKTWSLFQRGNADLIDDCLGVLSHYFSKDELLSDDAKVFLTPPDIRNI